MARRAAGGLGPHGDDFSFVSPVVKYVLFFFNMLFWVSDSGTPTPGKDTGDPPIPGGDTGGPPYPRKPTGNLPSQGLAGDLGLSPSLTPLGPHIFGPPHPPGVHRDPPDAGNPPSIPGAPVPGDSPGHPIPDPSQDPQTTHIIPRTSLGHPFIAPHT